MPHELLGYLDPFFLIKTAGYAGLAFIVFAECGLFFGFFFPGDSLLFTAGLLASQGYLNLGIVIAIAVLGNILGNAVGYSFGLRVGRRLFQRDDTLFFKKKYVYQAETFYNRYGAKTIVIACFVPIVRTFAPIVAGVGKMTYKTFAFYNVIGALIWGVGMPILGYALGNIIPAESIDKYLLPIIGVIIILSILPAVGHYRRERKLDSIGE
jgi:membrane-associated protein